MIWGIGEKEEIDLTEGGVNAVLRVSRRNVHRAVNLLQAASARGDKVDGDAVYRAGSTARPEEVENMVKLAFNGEFEEAREKLLDLRIERGIEPETLLKQIQEEIPKLDVPEPVEIKLIQKMGDFDFDLLRGANPRIQIEGVLTHLGRIGNRLKS
ncbi:hypothetical protein AKJ65_06340 [candidate division MSBL1 archaeon SCGC-AAA259E19]|uniref:Replication factor C small subunit n=1 Tax=candidate division MSBL1 archaeon SCGC-AAA259E19 TaxID=1698264 RepID=A0A133UGY1_9EURY|nr:hypothetical protein AKJ65_06340 [candidate division MSBL1 archaeon SCGC-AAA259E19]